MTTRTHTHHRSAIRINQADRADNIARSIDMYSLHEALARERIRELERHSLDATQVRELSAQRRAHRILRRARVADRRHARKADWTLSG